MGGRGGGGGGGVGGGGGGGSIDERNAWGVYRPELRSVTGGYGGVKFSGKKKALRNT